MYIEQNQRCTIYVFLMLCFAAQLVTFKEKLKNVVAEEGKMVTLHCELSKAGVPVEWWNGDELLQPGEKYQMKERDASVELIIREATPEDSGVYRCVCGQQKTKATIKIVGREAVEIHLCWHCVLVTKKFYIIK